MQLFFCTNYNGKSQNLKQNNNKIKKKEKQRLKKKKRSEVNKDRRKKCQQKTEQLAVFATILLSKLAVMYKRCGQRMVEGKIS